MYFYLEKYVYRATYQQKLFFLDSWAMKMGSIGCTETSVRNYHYSLSNNAEERNSHDTACSRAHPEEKSRVPLSSVKSDRPTTPKFALRLRCLESWL